MAASGKEALQVYLLNQLVFKLSQAWLIPLHVLKPLQRRRMYQLKLVVTGNGRAEHSLSLVRLKLCPHFFQPPPVVES